MKLKVILNPKSSKCKNKEYLKTMLDQKFTNTPVDIETTAYARHGSRIACQALKEKVDTIVVVGGDGTVNEVVNAIAGSKVALGIIPTGTANDLASFYHIPTDVQEACDIILERRLRPVDVIDANGFSYLTVGGVGLPCEVARIANRLKNAGLAGRWLAQILGSKLYILAFLLAFLKNYPEENLLKIEWKEGSLIVDSLSLTVSNQPFLGKNFLISPGALNNDGLFDVCSIEKPKRRVQILQLLIKVLRGGHLHSPAVKSWRTSKLVISADSPIMFFSDGETFRQALQFRIKILPRALNLIVPKGEVGK